FLYIYTIHIVSFLLLIPPTPSSTLFPYTRSSDLYQQRRNRWHCNNRLEPCQPLPTGRRSSLRSCFPRLLTQHVAGSSFASCCARSEEHTSELQSRGHLVCRLLLEKKKKPNP